MLPSTSSPVESAAAPVVLPCHSHDASEGQAAAGPGEESHQPPPVDLGVCGVGEGRRRQDMKPPDLCSGGGHNYGEEQRSGTWGTEAEYVTAEGCCEADLVRRQALCSSQMEEEPMEEGAWCSLPHSSGQEVDQTETVMSGSTMVSLPDLCDTSSGVHGRLHLSHGIVNDCEPQPCPCDSQSLGTNEGLRLDCYENDFENAPSLSQITHENVDSMREGTYSSESSSVREVNPHQTENEGHKRLSGDPNDDSVMFEEENETPPTSEEHSKSCNNVRTESSEDCSVRSKDRAQVDEPCGPEEQYLVHDTQRISLVACGVTQCDAGPQDVAMADLSNTQQPGLSLISHNLHHSSHPMFDKWPCYFYITQDHLPTFSIDSHGRHIGSEAPIFFPPASSAQAASGLTEEEQVKMAKRMGLITHLPCGAFDESKKSGECVICMIDFSVGDQVRYLPCMHTYHTQCIDDWLMRSFTCPSCLEPVDAALLNTYGSS